MNCQGGMIQHSLSYQELNQAEEIKALRAEILELKKKLYDETMRADFCDTMIDVAEEMFGIEIRKKADTGQSKGCAEKSGIQ